MFSTAIIRKPSATSTGLRLSPVSRSISSASAANFSRTTSSSSGSPALGPNTLGKKLARILPTITLASVTQSGPPLR